MSTQLAATPVRGRMTVGTESREFSRNAVAAAIASLTLLAAILRFYNLAEVPLNPFYDAAVRSMSLSWHNFFFAAFEPGGSVAVDKPPLELWLQVLSTKIFGFNSLALKLPEALAGTLAVPLVFDVVRRLFGAGAGLASAAALTVLPISVITSRSDTMDSLMMFLLLLTVWSITLALQRRDGRFLLLAAVIIGVNFDVKLFEAMLPVPAIALFYLLGSEERAARRVGILAAAALVAAVVGLLWPVAISVAPQKQRAWALGSTNGTIWNSMFVFDGLNRVGIGVKKSRGGTNFHNPNAVKRMFKSGPRQLGEFIGTMLVASLLFGVAALLLAGGEMLRGPPDGRIGEELRLRRAGVAMLVFWMLSVGAAMSLTSRLHPRYLEAFTPAVVMTLGVGVAWVAHASRSRPWLASAAIAACCSGTVYFATTLKTTKPLTLQLMIAAVVIAVLATALRALAPSAIASQLRGSRWTVAIGALALLPVLISPFAVSQRLIAASYTDSNYGTRDLRPAKAAYYAKFFADNRGKARYQAIVRTPSQASELIVRNGLPVILLQNVGRKSLVTPAQIARVVAAGDVHYALLGRRCAGPKIRPLCPETARWVIEHGVLLKHSVGLYALGESASAKGKK